MVRAALCVLLASIALSGGYTAAAAPQAQQSSARLAAIRVTGSTRFSSDQIAPYTGLKVGSQVTRADLQSGADHLAALGCFSGVQYKFDSGASGVSVEYAVTDSPGLPVTFDNFIWFTDAELSKGLAQSGILFDGRAPDHGPLLDNFSTALEKLLDSRGIHAQVSHDVIPAVSGSGQVVQFRVDGYDLNVTSIEYTDPLASGSRDLEMRQEDIIGKPYSRVRLELFEQEQVLPVYLSHAYLQASFDPPSAKFTQAPGAASSGPITAVIHVKPGPVFQWAGVTWQGNSAISSDILSAVVDLKPGDSADGVKVQGVWVHVEDLYTRHGFLDVTLDPHPQFDAAAGKVTYHVAIHEGPLYRMRNLVLSGLSIEGERRIRAAWHIAEGNPFDESAYEEFLNSGIKTAFAGLPVHYDKIGHFLDKHPDSGQVDVLLDFQ